MRFRMPKLWSFEKIEKREATETVDGKNPANNRPLVGGWLWKTFVKTKSRQNQDKQAVSTFVYAWFAAMNFLASQVFIFQIFGEQQCWITVSLIWETSLDVYSDKAPVDFQGPWTKML